MAKNTPPGQGTPPPVPPGSPEPIGPFIHPLQLAGTRRDNEARAIARTEFLRLIRADPRVVAVFQANGILAAGRDLAHEADRIAERTGLDFRWQLYNGSLFLPPGHEAAWVPWFERWTAWRDRIGPELETFSRSIEHLITEIWRLPWRWPRDDLYVLFLRTTVLSVYADPLSMQVRYEVEAPPAPEVHFVPQEHETPTESADRLRRVLDDLKSLVQSTSHRGGVQATDAVITRDVEWFYRHHLKEPSTSIRVLAREYHETSHEPGTRDTDHRSTVRSGIKRARRLLDDVPRMVLVENPPQP